MNKNESRRIAQIKRRVAQKVAIMEYLGNQCAECGISAKDLPEGGHTVFDCNHINPADKSFSIAGEGKGYTWTKLKPELDKCELLCATCHRIVTWRQRQ